MAQGATLLVLSLSVLVTVIAATGKSPVAVRTEKCSRNRVLPIPNGKLKRVAKGAVEFLVKCDKGFKASGGSEAGVVRCSTEGEIENVEDAPKCLMRKDIPHSTTAPNSGSAPTRRQQDLALVAAAILIYIHRRGQANFL